ncbi:MAG TPA: hypothetical protein VMU99_08285 [Acidimicrobiales bacterium]|nr:hypothetical protein [Acidimicrobiales bacterium]
MTSQPRFRTIQELADLLGRYRFVELTLFGITGRGVASSGDASLAVQLSAASHAHAYRAELIERRLLVSDGLNDASRSTRTPSEEHEILFEAIGKLDGEELGVMLAFAWYPAMLAAYTERLETCDRASEGPIRLMLSRLVFDLGTTVKNLSDPCDPSRFASGILATQGRIVDVGGPFGTPSS